MTEKATVKLYRFDPTVDKEPRYETYEVPSEGWQGRMVLDTLRYIYEHFDNGFSFRGPCHQRDCGACTIRINGKTALACDVVAEKEMVIEPVPKRQVLKDLVVDIAMTEE